MDVKTVRAIVQILALGLFVLYSTGCLKKTNEPSFNIQGILSYRDIPGVTDEEITAIEALKSAKSNFSFGCTLSTEAFILPDGRYAGFTSMFCEFLSGLFGIPFIQEFHSWNSMKSGIDNGTLDFVGDFTPTPERRQQYFMTHPIAERMLSVYTYGDLIEIKQESDLAGLRIGFYADSVTVQSILNVYPSLNFKIIDVENAGDAVEKLKAGIIDAFIIDAVVSNKFEDDPLVRSWTVLPLVYTPVSLTAANPELEPVISVMNKYITQRGIDKLYELYKAGNQQYKKYEFERLLSSEERAYLDFLAINNAKVPIALESGNYPTSFYNDRDLEYQGIAVDVLFEIGKITGIEFEVMTNKNMKWPEILEKLKKGEAALVSELLYTEERKNDFLWPDQPYSTSNYAFLSKSDYPILEIYQVVRVNVGFVTGSAYEEIYYTWYPNSTNTKSYSSHTEALIALESGEINLLLTNTNMLLTQLNYREKPGYKANIILHSLAVESFFGINKKEKILTSIINKAQRQIVTDVIISSWTNRLYDYSKEFARQAVVFSVIFIGMLLISLVIVIILFVKNRQTSRLYKNEAVTLSAIYKSLPDLVYSKDVNGAYLNCNNRFEEFAGCSESEIIGRSSLELFKIDKNMAQLFMDGDNIVIKEKMPVKTEQYFTFPDCSSRLFENVKVPLIQNNKVVGLLGIARDISEHKAAEEAAKEITAAKTLFFATLENVLSNLDSMIYVNDPETGEILFVNDKMKRHFGIEGDGTGLICYKTFRVGLDKRCNPCPCDYLDKEPDKILVRDEPSVLSNRIFRNTNQYIDWIGGKKAHLQHSIDITELINTKEMAQEASRAKSDFLAKMSHEIRTPMNAIIGMTELALRADEPDEAREHILTVKQASANLLSIINDILDFSKIETGKFEINQADYSFSSLVNDVINIIRMRVIDSQVRFVVNIDCNIPNALIGDEIRIRQVLLNLLNNAVKYTEKGYVSFTAYGEITGDNTVNLSLEVMDSGRGIKEEDIAHLFNEYSQFDLEKNKGIEGTGLGLAIAYGIVKAMNGDIVAHSKYGQGSVFTVSLPQTIRSPKPLAQINNPEEKKVIVYERREIYALSVIYSIESLGVTTNLVSNDSELYEKMSNEEYNFVFISFRLFKKNKDTIAKFGKNAKIVVLAEFGEMIQDKKLNILAMPVHCISIADILNGVAENFSYNENNELIVRFTAPKAKVLVVDDIRTNLKVVEGLMLPYKMKVDLCKSGMEAIEAIKTNHYDVIFMDHKMPEMDGIETTLRIRAMGEEKQYYKNVPIIALTANVISGTKELFLENGFNDYLSKPIDTVKLNAELERWIPKEKQKGSTIGVTTPVQEERETTADIEIEGLDVNTGISLSGGTAKLYFETLAVFYKDAHQKINEIESCVDSKNLSLYAIHLHALKSATAIIGAGDLSEAAKALEDAGGSGNFDFIEAHNELFISDLKALLDKINEALSVYENGSKKDDEPLDEESLRQELMKLKEALAVLDAGAINRTVDALWEFALPDDASAVIGNINESILFADYDKAEALIDSLLKRGK